VHILKELVVKSFGSVVDKGVAGDYFQKTGRLGKDFDLLEASTNRRAPIHKQGVGKAKVGRENAELYAKKYSTRVKYRSL
jgi:hypothetical protein